MNTLTIKFSRISSHPAIEFAKVKVEVQRTAVQLAPVHFDNGLSEYRFFLTDGEMSSYLHAVPK